MQRSDVIIVGGGIAGLSVAWHLARAGAQICLLEREWACGTQASGMNAAIFRSFDADATTVRLAVRSRELMEMLTPALIRKTGAVYLAPATWLQETAPVLNSWGVPFEMLTSAEVARRFPLLAPGALPGALLPHDGVIDTHALVEALKCALLRAGARVCVGSTVTRIERHEGGHAVALGTGETLWARRLVLAGGAWSAHLGELAGLGMPVEPRRRHLVALAPPVEVTPSHPVVWRLEDEVYFRPESAGVLASPCDEEPWPAHTTPPVAADQLVRLGELLTGFAPALASAPVRRAWSCLRSFAADRQFVVGPDKRTDGLFWLAGLGGRGMTCALALGEELAASMLGTGSQPPSFSPARLLHCGVSCPSPSRRST